jgi:hypothetical protein
MPSEDVINLWTEAARALARRVLQCETELGGLSAAFLARSAQSLRSTSILARHGWIGDAMSVARTIVELSIDFAYIATDPENLVSRFLAYEPVVKLKLVEAISRLHDGDIPAEAVPTLKARIAEAEQRYPGIKSISWAVHNLRQRAELADTYFSSLPPASEGAFKQWANGYELAYVEMCAASHSGYMTLEYAMWREGDDNIVNFSPMPADPKPVLIGMTMMLLMMERMMSANSADDPEGWMARLENELRRIHGEQG